MTLGFGRNRISRMAPGRYNTGSKQALFRELGSWSMWRIPAPRERKMQMSNSPPKLLSEVEKPRLMDAGWVNRPVKAKVLNYKDCFIHNMGKKLKAFQPVK